MIIKILLIIMAMPGLYSMDIPFPIIVNARDFLAIKNYINEMDGNSEINSTLISKKCITSITMIKRDAAPMIRVATNEKIGLMTKGDAIYYVFYPTNEFAEKGYEEIKLILSVQTAQQGVAPEPALDHNKK